MKRHTWSYVNIPISGLSCLETSVNKWKLCNTEIRRGLWNTFFPIYFSFPLFFRRTTDGKNPVDKILFWKLSSSHWMRFGNIQLIYLIVRIYIYCYSLVLLFFFFNCHIYFGNYIEYFIFSTDALTRDWVSLVTQDTSSKFTWKNMHIYIRSCVSQKKLLSDFAWTEMYLC